MEIERKFLVDSQQLLKDVVLQDHESKTLEQVYISTEGNEVRIRVENKHADNKCFLTIKSSGDMVREEVELEISYGQYSRLLKMHKGNIISKLRYIIPLRDGDIAELDLYNNDLFGLFTVEVEFDTEEEANQFVVPLWFGQEVTNDKSYKNKNLAIYGI